MSSIRQIYNFPPGDTYSIIRDIDALAYGVPSEGWFTVKTQTYQNDSQAALQIHVVTSGINGSTLNVYPDGTSQITFYVVAGQSLNMLPNNTYYYDIQIKTSIGEVFTLEEGRLFTTNTVTQLY